MTLDIPKFITNVLEKQMKILHFDANVKVLRTESIPSNIQSKIKELFGDEYLGDAEYVVFYKGHIDKKKLKKMFNVTDKSLGEDANRLTEGDFRLLIIQDDDEVILNPDGDESDTDEIAQNVASNEDSKDDELEDTEVDSIVNDDSDDENFEDETNDEIDDSDDEDETEDETNDDSDDEDETEDETNDDSDDETKKLDESDDEVENIPIRFFFLKITMKK